LDKKASSPCSPSFGLALPFWWDDCWAWLSSDAGVRPREARLGLPICREKRPSMSVQEKSASSKACALFDLYF
jgi:hypothetical protein